MALRTSIGIFLITSLLLVFSPVEPASADAMSDAIAWCNDYERETGVNCDAQRCPCGRTTREFERWDRGGLRFSVCACVSRQGLKDAANKPSESQCESNSDCNDGLWCNGVERCEVATWTAPDGSRHRIGQCLPGTPPCDGAAQCREESDRCEMPCKDEDGDGFAALSCGGNDCDDTDPNRYPGNTEICDPQGIDEDCDPTTVGTVDRDGDGFISAECR